MYSILINSAGVETTFTTQQYMVGTYIIVNNDPRLQSSTQLPEETFHIKIRTKCLKDGGTIKSGSFVNSKNKLLNPIIK